MFQQFFLSFQITEIQKQKFCYYELRTKYKVTVSGPNTLSALLQSYYLGFQTLKVQKHATQIYSDLNLFQDLKTTLMALSSLEKD